MFGIDLGDVVYRSLVQLFYAKLETNLTPAEASTLNVPLPDHPSSNVAKALVELQEDHTELRNQPA